MSAPVDVVEMEPRAVRPAARAVAEGFQDNEIWEWIIPSGWRRRLQLPRYYRSMIRSVFLPRGGAWTTADQQGAALWMPPGSHSLSRREQLVEALAMLPGALTGFGRGASLDRMLALNRPREPHWYLNTLSVRPGAQRRGIGSALIRPGLERADRDGVGCFLETQRMSNIPFYRRFGFALTDEVSTASSPPLWLMWREPR